MPDSLKRPKIKAKPRPNPPATPPPTHSGVSGTKRKNSRSPSAGAKRKAVRLEAASASSAPSHSGVFGVASAERISLKKPLEGKTFEIYSGGRNQTRYTRCPKYTRYTRYPRYSAHSVEQPCEQPLQLDWDREGFVLLQQLPDEAGMGHAICPAQ